MKGKSKVARNSLLQDQKKSEKKKEKKRRRSIHTMHEIISKNKNKETHMGPICLCYPNRIYGKIHKSAFSSLFKRKRA